MSKKAEIRSNTMRPENEKRESRAASVGLAALIIWGYFVIRWFPLPHLGSKVTLYALSAAGIALYYLLASGRRPSRGSYAYLAFMALLAFSFALFENSMICEPLFLLLPCLFVWWLLHAAQDFPLRVGDIPDSLSLLFFKPFQDVREKAAVFSPGEQRRKKSTYVLIGVGVTIPIFLTALHLLVGADALFGSLVGRFAEVFLSDLGNVLGRFGLGCLLALYLLSIFMSAVRFSRREEGRPLPKVNGTVLSIVIGALCALYLAFVLVQIGFLLGVFAEKGLSASFYSSYARDGFFELCVVTVMNLVVFLVAHVFREEATRSIKTWLTALAILTQALILTAIVKMGLYMNHYGLTLLRVQTLWFMVSIFVAFGLLIVLQWKDFNGFKAIALLAAVSILTASYANIGGIVAGENVKRYLAGNLASIQTSDYEAFPYAAAPHLIRLYTESQNEEVKSEITRFLGGINKEEALGWGDRSLQEMMASAEIQTFCESQAAGN